MDHLPIDIHSNKLLDWLISRRHCKKDWSNSIELVREKISHALKDMPEHEKIISIIRGSCGINYFRCREVVEVLKETERDSKNMFGYYSSQRVKDWQEIAKLYEINNLYLAESSHILQRLIQYEIPFLRRQIAKYINVIQDLERKEHQYERQSIESKKEYKQECLKWKIEGKRIQEELRSKCKNLPELFNGILRQLKKLQGAFVYYNEFRNFICSDNERKQKSQDELMLCKTLLQINDSSELTLFEWRYKRKPERIMRPNLEQNENDGKEDIVTDDEINFCIEVQNNDEFNLDSFELEVVQDGEAALGEAVQVAMGEDALFPLEHLQTLYTFAGEIHQIRSFIKIRILDQGDLESASSIYLSGVSRLPDTLIVESSVLEGWQKSFESILLDINNPQMVQMIKIISSPVFVEEVAAVIEKKDKLSQKYAYMSTLARNKIGETQELLQNAQKDVEEIIESAKFLQSMIETEISKKYNNREVNIMGEINAVLYPDE